MVDEFLQKHESLKHYSYRDQRLPCSPNLRRGDFVYVLEDRIVFLEIDEYAHRYYERSCECVRILELSEQAQGLPINVIRFNPKKKLLDILKKKLETSFNNKINTYINVEFIGYTEEYNVIEECMRIMETRI